MPKMIKSLLNVEINQRDFYRRLIKKDGLSFVGCCGGLLYQRPIKKKNKIDVFGITVANRRVTGHNNSTIDKTIVKTSNGYLTIFATKNKTGKVVNV